MGRGLSDLQRWILRETCHRGQLEYADIRRDYFGWKPKQKDQQLRDRYSPQDLGADEYNRVMATISRSCRRLEARGLKVRRIRCEKAPYSGLDPRRHMSSTDTCRCSRWSEAGRGRAPARVASQAAGPAPCVAEV